ncbi:MAG: thioredoxin family protein [Desulfobacterales bacterium]|nr:thioredoxin family protein [Desulfobacterales bacterium]
MKAKKIVFLILSLVFAYILTLNSTQAGNKSPETIKWYSYEEGLAKASKDQKKIFLSFYADWCYYCKKLDKDTFSDSSVISYLQENFISIKVNGDNEKKIASQFKIRAYPSLWFLKDNGEKINSYPGYLSADKFVLVLKYINTDSFKTMSFNDFLSSQEP